MTPKALFSETDQDEIDNAAELCGIQFDEFVKRATLWVIFNYPEAIAKKRHRVDRPHNCIV